MPLKLSASEVADSLRSPNYTVRILGDRDPSDVGWAVAWGKAKLRQLSNQIRRSTIQRKQDIAGKVRDHDTVVFDRRYYYEVNGKGVKSIELFFNAYNALWTLTLRTVEAGISPVSIVVDGAMRYTPIAGSASRGLNKFVANETEVPGVFDVPFPSLINGVLESVTLDGEGAPNVTLKGPQSSLAATRMDVKLAFQKRTISENQSRTLERTIEAISSPRNAASQSFWRGTWYKIKDFGSIGVGTPAGVGSLIFNSPIAIRVTPELVQDWMIDDVKWFVCVPVYMANRADGTRSIFLTASTFGGAINNDNVSDISTITIEQFKQHSLLLAEIKDVDNTLLGAEVQNGIPTTTFNTRKFQDNVTVTPGGTVSIVIIPGVEIELPVPETLTSPMLLGTGSEISNDGSVKLEAVTLFQGTVAADGSTASGTLFYEPGYLAAPADPEDDGRRAVHVINDASVVEFHDLRPFAVANPPLITPIPGDYIEDFESSITFSTTVQHRAAQTIWEWSYGLLWAEARRATITTEVTAPSTIIATGVVAANNPRGRMTFDGTTWVNVDVPDDQTHLLRETTEFISDFSNSVDDDPGAGSSSIVTVTFADGRTKTTTRTGEPIRRNTITDFQETVVGIVNGEKVIADLSDIPVSRWDLFPGEFADAIQFVDTQEGRFYWFGSGRTGTTLSYSFASVVGGNYEEVAMDGGGNIVPRGTNVDVRTITPIFSPNQSDQDIRGKLFGNVGLIRTFPTAVFKIESLPPAKYIDYGIAGDHVLRTNFKLSWPSIMGQRGQTFIPLTGNPGRIQKKNLAGDFIGLVRGAAGWGLGKPVIWQMNNMLGGGQRGFTGGRAGSILWKDITPGRDGVVFMNLDRTQLNSTSARGGDWRDLEARFAAGDITVTQADVDAAYVEFTDTYEIIYNNFASLDFIEAVFGTEPAGENVMILNPLPEEET